LDERVQKIEALHRQYGGVIYDLCVRILRDRAAAEDAVQETFVSAFRSFSSFRYGEGYLPWLYRIGTNACKKIIRKNRTKWADLSEHSERLSAPEGDPINRIHVRRVLEYLMDDLDERGQYALAAYYLWGMSQGQIASALGISRRAVVKRLKALRKSASHLFKEDSNDD
jgi:RNA polymerase sigma-70 factor (ECF subfamily)